MSRVYLIYWEKIILSLYQKPGFRGTRKNKTYLNFKTSVFAGAQVNQTGDNLCRR